MDPVSVQLDLTARAIAALPVLERLCLAVLAAELRPCNRSLLANRLHQADVRKASSGGSAAKHGGRSPGGNLVSTGDLTPMMKRWTKLGLVTRYNEASDSFMCTPEAAHLALSEPACRELLLRLHRMLEEPSPGDRFRHYEPDPLLARLRRARLALYCGKPADADHAITLAKGNAYASDQFDMYWRLLDPRAPVEALRLMSAPLQHEYLAQVLPRCVQALVIPSSGLLAEATRTPALRALAATLAAVGGAGDANTWLDADPSGQAIEARAACALVLGEFDDARELAAQVLVPAQGKQRPPTLSGPLAPLLSVALATGRPDQVAAARAQLARVTSRGKIPPVYAPIAILLGEGPASSARSSMHSSMELLCFGLVTLFLGERSHPNLRRSLEQLSEAYRQGGAHWLAAQAEAVAQQLEPAKKDQAAATHARALTGLYRPLAPWERALAMLESLQPAETALPSTDTSKANAERRLVFLVQVVSQSDLGEVDDDAAYLDAYPHAELPQDFAARNHGSGGDATTAANSLIIEPRLQVRRGHGYSTGRAISLRALAEPNADVDYLTPDDQRVTARISSQRTWSGRQYYFSARAALALVGHPRVFWHDRPEGPAVDVSTRPPVLKAERSPAGLQMRLEPVPNAAGVGVMIEGADRLVVTELSPSQLNVHRALRELPPIPIHAETRLRLILGRMAALFTVHSEFGVEASKGAFEELPPDSRPVVQLVRAEPGLRVRVSVQPLGVEGPGFVPAEGLVTVATELTGRRVSCQRDLTQERHAFEAILHVAPALRAAVGGVPLHLDILQDCLSLLQALESLADAVTVRWPEGAPIVVVAEAELSSLRLVLDEREDWLHATGTLKVDEGQVLDMQRVLEQRTLGGGYVALGEDRYLALSAELQEQLSALEAAAEPPAGDGAGLRIPPVALGFVSPWLKLLRAAGGLQVDKRTKAQLGRIERAYASTPELPKTFDAELRTYQVAGYEFLHRLAQIGAGACLADDMGLGKTLMTLALLVARAELGPALVVAPTSVRANWFDEALRFAPTLRMRRLDGAEGVKLDELEPFDVLVCSYTVMAQRIDPLERVSFATAVLDESQAIKNVSTQRARAALRLSAEARVALTGTPIENHLGDLHGLMSFLNPGLLGDTKHFEARFGKPIQRERDDKARDQLRRLIGPFVLRRRKSEVLRELPPRTEITLRVEPEAAEQAFTEALRRAALARLSSNDATPSRAGSAVSILAEIMRLRRAACHPQLVDPDADCGTAKLERLVELVHELRDGGHRALVFSQFVDFLRLVRTRLDREGFSSQYLDGSTSEPGRRKAVQAFQAGEGDLFLISLKAGGFGLNLTAADYVIHLDPWWNPAVEAQASDRAHRIGQQRPVTIYRLINAASIEERVLALHDRKQALAEELLSDSAEAMQLDAETLMSLVRE